jgi:hypothetical protein
LASRPKLSNRKQPAYFLLKKQGRGIAPTAKIMAVPYLQLRAALYGTARPSQEIRERLPGLLGRPLVELFEAASLRPPRGSETCDCDTCTVRRIQAARP